MAERTAPPLPASIGTMQVNEEIVPLQTTSILDRLSGSSPDARPDHHELPLLTLYADLMGILERNDRWCLGTRPEPHGVLQQTTKAVSLTNLWIGLFPASCMES
jgi:hypothetical protein